MNQSRLRHAVLFRSGTRSPADIRLILPWKSHCEVGEYVFLAVRGDLPAENPCQVLAQSQSYPSPGIMPVGEFRLEIVQNHVAVENVRQLVPRYPGAAVSDGYHQIPDSTRTGRNLYPPLVRRVFHGIGKEIEDYLLQHASVRHPLGQPGLYMECQPYLFGFRDIYEIVRSIFQKFGHIHFLVHHGQMSRIGLAELHEFLYLAVHPVRIAPDGHQLLRIGGIPSASSGSHAEYLFHRAENQRDGIREFMGDICEETEFRLHYLLFHGIFFLFLFQFFENRLAGSVQQEEGHCHTEHDADINEYEPRFQQYRPRHIQMKSHESAAVGRHVSPVRNGSRTAYPQRVFSWSQPAHHDLAAASYIYPFMIPYGIIAFFPAFPQEIRNGILFFRYIVRQGKFQCHGPCPVIGADHIPLRKIFRIVHFHGFQAQFGNETFPGHQRRVDDIHPGHTSEIEFPAVIVAETRPI